ncbi:MAG: hypothetical protein GC154_14945 [bacterium]|nr:hypothetical protein [bacterium]
MTASSLRTVRVSQRGSIFIVVLWVTFGLVTVAILFGHSMTMELRVSENEYASLQADEIVESAGRYAMTMLSNLDTPGLPPAREDYENQGVSVGDGFFWFIGRDADNEQYAEPVYGLVDECSKLNINTATLEMLQALPGMTDEFAASIVDWRDEDDDVTENGAESQTYLLRRPGYECKNAPFDSVEELRLVYGATLEELYGEDANQNGVLDPNENDGDESYPLDNRDGKLDFGLLEYVTVYSREPNKNEDGEARVDVTATDTQSLSDLLNEKFDSDRASEILANVSTGTAVTSLVEFYQRSQMTLAEFAEVEGGLTVGDDDFREGLINVNTAPAEVLACLPGVDESTARSLVDYRRSHSDAANTSVWITEVLDEAVAVEAGPYITSRSWQYAADIAAVGRYGRGYRRARLIVDMSGDEPALRFRRDLTGTGWALGDQTRRQLIALKEETRR